MRKALDSRHFSVDRGLARREFDTKARACAGRGIERDKPALMLADALDEREPEAEIVRARFAAAHEWGENMGLHARRDARTVVGDFETGGVGAHENTRAAGRVLERVADQIREHYTQQ